MTHCRRMTHSRYRTHYRYITLNLHMPPSLAHARPSFTSERGLSSHMFIRTPSASRHITANMLDNVIALFIINIYSVVSPP